MYERGLVNILTPAYNSAHLISRLLDSVLKQTYSQISMIVIDDGSIDNTREVIERYIPLFADKGYKLQYVYQQNSGQSSAINNGLKLITGEYFAWPDSDDWNKTDDAIEKMVSILKHTTNEVGLVRCQMEYVKEETLLVEHTTSITPCNVPCDLIEESMIQTNDFYYAPIGWMIKVKLLDEYIPNREIYASQNSGQNAQILWPYFVSSKCITIDKVLASYLVRGESHSRERKDYQKQLAYFTEQLKCNISVIESLPLPIHLRKKYIHSRQEYYLKAFLDLDYRRNGTHNFRKHYKECVEFNIPIENRYHRVYLWTYVFNIKSYKFFQKAINIFRKLTR